MKVSLKMENKSKFNDLKNKREEEKKPEQLNRVVYDWRSAKCIKVNRVHLGSMDKQTISFLFNCYQISILIEFLFHDCLSVISETPHDDNFSCKFQKKKFLQTFIESKTKFTDLLNSATKCIVSPNFDFFFSVCDTIFLLSLFHQRKKN